MQIWNVAAPLMGGAMIGLSASLLLLFNGRIAGISGILGGILIPQKQDLDWRVAFVSGLVVGGLILLGVHHQAFQNTLTRPLAVIAIAGLLVGFGTRLGNGCTSGHGVCGMSRLSKRSLAATLTFIASGAVTVFLYRIAMGV
jgi:uncharacterized protein